MKQIIILCAMIFLGMAIFDLIAGPGDQSILQSIRDVWSREIESQRQYP